ncbi:MAG: SDR family oxidoreductase [Alphaproteobacteria bacterium]|nr:SDR family oxidoreductase [Alphaproteobacteria bacterium]
MPTVLITGANRGLGLEFVQQYAADGWSVIALCRDPAQAADLNAEAAKSGGRVSVDALDVLDFAAVDAAAARHAGRAVDVLINNAGIIGPVRDELAKQSFGTMDYTAWERVLRTNTMAPFKVTEAFFPNLMLGEHKKVAVISSTVGSNVEMQAPVVAYSSSKAGVTKTFTTLAAVLRDKGVTVMVFCPGHVKTDMGGEGAGVERYDSIAGMRKLIAGWTLAESGQFKRFNGETVAF